jgi:hypothetical protein
MEEAKQRSEYEGQIGDGEMVAQRSALTGKL